jgi:hypothetical protein
VGPRFVLPAAGSGGRDDDSAVPSRCVSNQEGICKLRLRLVEGKRRVGLSRTMAQTRRVV